MMTAPKLYTRELELVGGRNQYGLPNFILWWTGDWRPDAPLLPILDNPSWALMEWHPPVDAGHPELWPGEVLGPYPNRGYYDILQPFRRGSEPSTLDSAELNVSILRQMVRMMLKIRDDSMAKRMEAFKERDRLDSEARQKQIADILHDGMPAFGKAEAISYRGNPGTTTTLKKRIEQIYQNLSHSNEFSRLGRGSRIE